MPNKKLTAKKLDILAVRIIMLLQENDLFCDTNLYLNNKKYSSNKTINAETKETVFGEYYITNDIDVTQCVEYNNPKTITMTFEGPLYDIMNYSTDSPLIDKLTKLLKSYGLYYEQGYMWSLALYPE